MEVTLAAAGSSINDLDTLNASRHYTISAASDGPGGDVAQTSSVQGLPLNATQPKAKRIACVLCRKRKLRCDGTRPACATCTRLGHECSYNEVRRKSGPKRGYVKLLEQRLQQVETLLKTHDQPSEEASAGSNLANSGRHPAPRSAAGDVSTHSRDNGRSEVPVGTGYDGTMPLPNFNPDNVNVAEFGVDLNMDLGTPSFELNDAGMMGDLSGENFLWEMIGLGLEEPLPPQDTIDDLHRIYFDKVHQSCPLLHQGRYLAACSLNHQMRPSIALRYAVWTCAASITDKYAGLAEHFYHRARKYLQADEMRSHGEGIISIQHCQTWILICIYEFKNMYFPRAWQTTGRAVRMAQMLGLHRIDGYGLDVKQCLPPPKDWIEREERRRTFWMAFCEDRYASVGTGWPMTIDERDIMTNLPASEESFICGTPEETTSLRNALKPMGACRLSSIGGVIVLSCMFGRNLLHLHRPSPDDQDDDLNGEFWRRHRLIESILSHTSLSLPDSLRLPAGLGDPNVVFLNMAIHTSAICLHQAAIFKADRHSLPSSIGSESRTSCVTAAAEIARIMRMLSHLDLSTMNPFLAFCLYVAARVFVQYLKVRPNDEQIIASLQFLLAAMHAMKRKNPLVESFLVQLDVDLEGMNLNVGPSIGDAAKQRVCELELGLENMRCSPLFESHNHQSRSRPTDLADQKAAATNTASDSAGGQSLPDFIIPPNMLKTTRASQVDDRRAGKTPSFPLASRKRHATYESSAQALGSGESLSLSSTDSSPSPAVEQDVSSGSGSKEDSASQSPFTPHAWDKNTGAERHLDFGPYTNMELLDNSSLSATAFANTRVFEDRSGKPVQVVPAFGDFEPDMLNQQFPSRREPSNRGWEMSEVGNGLGSGPNSLATSDWDQMLDSFGGLGEKHLFTRNDIFHPPASNSARQQQ